MTEPGIGVEAHVNRWYHPIVAEMVKGVDEKLFHLSHVSITPDDPFGFAAESMFGPEGERKRKRWHSLRPVNPGEKYELKAVTYYGEAERTVN